MTMKFLYTISDIIEANRKNDVAAFQSMQTTNKDRFHIGKLLIKHNPGLNPYDLFSWIMLNGHDDLVMQLIFSSSDREPELLSSDNLRNELKEAPDTANKILTRVLGLLPTFHDKQLKTDELRILIELSLYAQKGKYFNSLNDIEGLLSRFVQDCKVPEYISSAFKFVGNRINNNRDSYRVHAFPIHTKLIEHGQVCFENKDYESPILKTFRNWLLGGIVNDDFVSTHPDSHSLIQQSLSIFSQHPCATTELYSIAGMYLTHKHQNPHIMEYITEAIKSCQNDTLITDPNPRFHYKISQSDKLRRLPAPLTHFIQCFELFCSTFTENKLDALDADMANDCEVPVNSPDIFRNVIKLLKRPLPDCFGPGIPHNEVSLSALCNQFTISEVMKAAADKGDNNAMAILLTLQTT